jgi:hypothetical protein
MKKHEIRVTIDSVEKQQKAIEILNRYNEPIWKDKHAMLFDNHTRFNSLRIIYNEWYISSVMNHQTEITLDELETILKNESK